MTCSRRFRVGFQILTVCLPWFLRRPLLVKALGWQIHSTARIGLSIVEAEHLKMKEGARIGHFNVINRLRLLDMGPDSVIAKYNWIRVGAFASLDETDAPGSLTMEAQSFITMMHFVDCSGGMSMGPGSALGGARSVVFGHGIDPETVRQSTKPVTIGANTIVASHSTVTPGASIAEGCFVGAGSVVVGELSSPGMLYAGSPAKPIKAMPAAFAGRLSRDFS